MNNRGNNDMKTNIIEHNDKIYFYCLIQDDTGNRVEVRNQDSITSGNELPILKMYLAEGHNISDDYLESIIKAELDKLEPK
jgi:hypothetical protein